MRNDRKQLCKKCIYRTKISVAANSTGETAPNICCDYIGVTGHARSLICSPEDCSVFKKGRPMRAEMGRAIYGDYTKGPEWI